MDDGVSKILFKRYSDIHKLLYLTNNFENSLIKGSQRIFVIVLSLVPVKSMSGSSSGEIHVWTYY